MAGTDEPGSQKDSFHRNRQVDQLIGHPAGRTHCRLLDGPGLPENPLLENEN